MPSRTTRRPSLLLATVLLVNACGGGGGDAGDDTATTTAAGAAADTGMAGMDHGAMASRGAARDSNQAFLRMMSDHHQGLIVMADTARPRLGGVAQTDAQQLKTKQQGEQEHMLGMLRSEYADSITPTILPSNQAMVRAVASAPAGDAGAVFYQQVIAHHREGVQMTEKMLPHLTGMSKQMAEKARTDQQREIAEFEKKLATGKR